MLIISLTHSDCAEHEPLQSFREDQTTFGRPLPPQLTAQRARTGHEECTAPLIDELAGAWRVAGNSMAPGNRRRAAYLAALLAVCWASCCDRAHAAVQDATEYADAEAAGERASVFLAAQKVGRQFGASASG